MSLSLQVIYPVSDRSQFDMNYYQNTHLPMVSDHMGQHIQSFIVTHGLAGGPDTPPGYHAVATLLFSDQAEMDAALAAAGPVLDDIPNFTNVSPDMLIGEVIS
ncbi:MAG: EthD family reductase [Roseovarius sp.]